MAKKRSQWQRSGVSTKDEVSTANEELAATMISRKQDEQAGIKDEESTANEELAATVISRKQDEQAASKMSSWQQR